MKVKAMLHQVRAIVNITKRTDWQFGYYFKHPTNAFEHWMITVNGGSFPVKPESVCRCSGFALRDDFTGDMHTLFEGDIVEYRNYKSVGYGIVRYGEFYKGGLGYEGNGFVEGIGWYIEHTEPTVKHFDMTWLGAETYLLHDEGELNKRYVYTGYDIFHNPEYITKEVMVDE